MHKEGINGKKYNKGTFFKYPIVEFINCFLNHKIKVNHCLGLANIGVTPYMNATLQSLCHITSLKNNFQTPTF